MANHKILWSIFSVTNAEEHMVDLSGTNYNHGDFKSQTIETK